MKLLHLGAALVAPAALAVALTLFAADEPRPAVYIQAENANYTQVTPGATRAILWGDSDKGPYGGFTRFKPGTKHARHFHTQDIRIVVLSGAYLYTDDDGAKRVVADSYLFIPGGKVHTSAGDEKEGCLFYEESQGAFDLVPIDTGSRGK